ncbi:MAG: protein dehydratase, partial [Pseudomonadota bacterium]
DVVVPTPLLAQHLIQFCERQGGGLKRFQYRSSSPLSVMEPATLCGVKTGAGMRLWAEGPDRRVCMTADATLGDGSP